MGRRTRKRLGGAPTAGTAATPSAGEPDSHRSSAPPDADGPPPPPWGSFPLTELAVLVSLAMVIGGFVAGGKPGTAILVAGLAVGSLAGFEQALREHRSGYRPHSAVLAGIPAVFAITAMAFLGVAPVIFAPIGLAIAIGVWLPVRSSFSRRD